MTNTETTETNQTKKNDILDLAIKQALSGKINALKNNQVKLIQMESKFYEELHALECRYAKLYAPLLDHRSKILNGEHEPTSEEITWKYKQNGANNDWGNANEVTDLMREMGEKLTFNEKEMEEHSFTLNELSDPKNYTGVPLFWRQAFNRTDLINDMIQEHDNEVIDCLQDIKCIMNDTKPYGYTLEFHFRENEFFTNKVLYKSYELTCDPHPEYPLSYDGPVMYKCTGTIINWNKGKDVTVRTVKKRQKHKSTGTVRVVYKECKVDSFFNFFDLPTSDGIRPSYREILNPGQNTMENDDMDDEIGEDLCNADFEIGHFFKEYIVPKALLYYTGDLIDKDEGEDLDDYSQEDDDDDDENDDNDEDEDMEAIDDDKTKSSK